MGVCVLIPLSSAGDCSDSDGGIYKVFITEAENITDATFDADNQITALTMSGVGLWNAFEPDDDDTAFFNQTGERDNNKHTSAQQGFIKFAGVNTAKVKSANGIKSCCALVAIWFSNSGAAYVQGIDYDGTAWKLTKRKVKATVNVLTDTGEGEDRVEITLDSVAREVAPLTTLTEAAIIAL